MKIRKSLGIVLMCFFLWMNQISYAREDLDHVNVLQEKQNQIQTEQNVRASGRESGRSTGDDGTNYPIQLSNNYHYGEQKISLEWTGVSDGTSLVDKAKVGDYIDYSIDEQTLEDNLKALPRRIRNSTDLTLNRTKWKVLRNDGKTIEIISTNPVARTQVSGQDYGWYEANPYGIGDYEGDHGGYGYYYQLNQIANSFSDKNFVQKARPLDFKDLDRSQELVQLQKYLGQEDAEQINIIIREGGFDEITDTQKHGDFFGIGGHPGFNVPLEEGLRFEDYVLEFGNPAHPTRVGFTEDCHLNGQDELYALEEERRIPLQHNLFDQDAIVLKNMDRCVTLRSDKGTRAVKVRFPQYTHLGFWHMPHTTAPYVCIEPWSSLPSRYGVVEDLSQQSDLVRLEAGKIYENQWSIEIIE